MLKYKNILFDLDGTLSDSSEGVFKGIRIAFEKHNKSIPEDAVLKTFIGPPLECSFANFFPKATVENVIATFKEYYRAKGLFENKLYNDIPKLLQELKGRGYQLFVATSKGEGSALRVIENFKIKELFDGIVGADIKIRTKEDVLSSLFKRYNLVKSETILIGDTKYDCIGAETAGIDVGVVLYGFGEIDDFKKFSPKFMAETPLEILKYFS